MSDLGVLPLPGALGSGAPKGLLSATLEDLSARALEGPAWLAERRGEAARTLSRAGFPAPKDEAWRLTPLHPVLRVPYSQRASGGRVAHEDGGASDVALVNGKVAQLASGTGGIAVSRFADVLAEDPARLEPYLGRLVTAESGFAAQNTSLFDDGVLLVARATGRQEALRLAHIGAAGESPLLGTPRVLVLAEPGSELLLVEEHSVRGSGAYLESAVTEVFVGANARVEHVRVQRGSAHGPSISTIAVRQSRASRYVSRVFTFGGALSRLDLRVLLDEPGAECVLDGLYLARNGDLVDHHTVIEHASGSCSSRERYKGILDGRSAGVFDGTVIVRRGAARTEAHQESRNLLLSDDAVAHTKPHLEIDTDDVKCSHGATVGRLDPAQLFYLRSRGMSADVARSLLTYAFAREVAEPVSPPDLRRSLEETIAAFLPEGAAAQELA